MPDLDSNLIARVLVRDDHAAFGELVRRHQSAVRNFLRHLSRGDAALADDLAQETFVRAYRSIRRYQGNSSFVSWLLGIAHNLWRNARRQQRNHVSLDGSEIDTTNNAAGQRGSELREDLKSALKTLSSDEQLALHLSYQQGLSHREIAELLDWPLGTVKTHLSRSKEKLRHLLAVWNPQT
ncbi:MAG: RNA polymerase sigma factor [Opitutus sp.]